MAVINHGKRKKNNLKVCTKQEFKSVLAEDAPFAYVEAYKTLRTNLDFISHASGVRSILVTSAISDESKSTTAINLAITLAGSNQAVIIVECDLRKPVLRKYLNLERGRKGLSDILAANAAPNECIIDAEKYGISILCAGTIPPNPSELLTHERMGNLIEILKQHYDYIILDAPPVTVVTDAVVVGRVADGALLVVRSKFASAKTVRLAKQRLESVNIKVLGAVVTHFNIKKSGWRSGYDYEGYKYSMDSPGVKI